MLSNELLLLLRAQFERDFAADNITKVAGGSMSHNFIISDSKNRYFLKQHRDDDLFTLNKINHAEQFFSDNGILVILPLTNPQGQIFISIDNKYYSLYPFIQAKQYTRQELPTSAIPSLATTLALMHLIGKGKLLADFSPEVHKSLDKSKFEQFAEIKQIITQQTNLSDFDQLALRSIELKTKLATSLLNHPPATLPADTLTHGDYQEGNIFFDEQHNVSHIFDFEKTRYSARAYEVVRAIEYMFLNNGYTPKNMASVKLFLTHYQTIYPISHHEIAVAYKHQYLSAVFTDWIELDHYILNNHRVDQFLPFQLQAINYLSQNLDKHVEDITSGIIV